MPRVRTPPCGFGISTLRTAAGMIHARQQRLSYARPVRLEPGLELGHRQSIDSRRTFVLHHSLVGTQQVAAFHYGFHQPQRLRFRSPNSRRARLSTRTGPGQVPPTLLRPGHTCVCFCFIVSHRGLLSYSRTSRLALRPASRGTTMAAADFWRFIPAPFDAGSPKANRQTSPGIAHSPSRLCLSDLRHGVPCKYWALHLLACSPRRAASIRFLFVRPALCLQLPPDSASRRTPLPFS